MAGNEFGLGIIIGAKDKTGKGIGSVGGKIDKLGKKMQNVGRSMTTGITLPVIGIGVAAVQSTSRFEAGMSNVATLVDTSTESMSEMSKKVLDIGKRTPVSMGNLTEALYNVRSAGVASGDAMTVLEQSARLGVAGLSSTGEAVDIVTSSLNAFKLKGAEAEGVYDVLFTAVKHGKTDLSKLGQGFGAVAGKVSDAGIAFDEYIAGVSAMTTTGLPAAQAHTQMRAALDGLTKSSKPLSKIFKRLGTKDFKSLIQESGGVVPAFAKMREAVGGSEAKMRALIGSSEGSAAVMSVTGTTFKAFTETLADMRDGVSEVDSAFKKQNETSAARWQRTKNALTAAAISIGSVLAPVLTKAAEKVQDLANWFGGLSDGTKKTIVQIAGVAAVVGPSLILFGKLASGISMVVSATRALSVVMLANPVGILIAGLLAIKAITGDSFLTLFSDAIEFWKERLNEFLDWFRDKFKFVLKYTGNIGVGPDVTGSNSKFGKALAKQKAIQEAGGGKAAMALKAGAENRAKAGKPELSKSHMIVEFWGQTAGVRVKSITGPDIIDVKTGHQGG